MKQRNDVLLQLMWPCSPDAAQRNPGALPTAHTPDSASSIRATSLRRFILLGGESSWEAGRRGLTGITDLGCGGDCRVTPAIIPSAKPTYVAAVARMAGGHSGNARHQRVGCTQRASTPRAPCALSEVMNTLMGRAHGVIPCIVTI